MVGETYVLRRMTSLQVTFKQYRLTQALSRIVTRYLYNIFALRVREEVAGKLFKKGA
ncbi:hypothetical protein GCM10007891_14690 [Methylophaga thalassica]|uniref:Uncharacterized protein n=1 Tax=Methylophaga thalassica TaxID=40223 RepID=A0ABQ5TVN7_9GAMM|nr:hypothetical protein GCM10007891_14690 [Methylophaga thalassica]